jgi:hypothetical protein
MCLKRGSSSVLAARKTRSSRVFVLCLKTNDADPTLCGSGLTRSKKEADDCDGQGTFFDTEINNSPEGAPAATDDAFKAAGLLRPDNGKFFKRFSVSDTRRLERSEALWAEGESTLHTLNALFNLVRRLTAFWNIITRHGLKCLRNGNCLL